MTTVTKSPCKRNGINPDVSNMKKAAVTMIHAILAQAAEDPVIKSQYHVCALLPRTLMKTPVHNFNVKSAFTKEMKHTLGLAPMVTLVADAPPKKKINK